MSGLPFDVLSLTGLPLCWYPLPLLEVTRIGEESGCDRGLGLLAAPAASVAGAAVGAGADADACAAVASAECTACWQTTRHESTSEAISLRISISLRVSTNAVVNVNGRPSHPQFVGRGSASPVRIPELCATESSQAEQLADRRRTAERPKDSAGPDGGCLIECWLWSRDAAIDFDA